MAEFDADAYFKSKPFNPNGTDKISDLISAREEKIQALSRYSQQVLASKQADKDSWVSKAGLTPQSVPANLVNLGANVAKSGADFAGWVASAPMNLTAALNEQGMTDQDTQAFARYNQGIATPEDMGVLNSKKIAPLYNNALPEIRAEAQRKANESDEVPTVLQSLQRAAGDRAVGRKVSNAFDIKDIVHNANTEEWNANLGRDFDPKWDAIKGGFKKALFEGDNSQIGAALSGVAGLAGNVGNALVDSPMGAAEALAGNVAQLGSGLLGKVGRAALAGSNVGNAADIYSKGIEKHQKENNGELPSADERAYMQAMSVAWAASEHAGDKLQIGAFKGGKDATRIGFKDALRNTGIAARKGAQGEAPTETFQSFAEGEINQAPTSAKQMFIEGVTGGVVGAGFSGGGRAMAEIAGATPEKRIAQATKDQEFQANAATGNTTPYLDKDSKDYDPVKAAQVNYINSLSAETTPEAKQQNVDKTNTLIKDLETERADLALTLSKRTSEGIQKQITDLEAGLENVPPQIAALKQMQIDSLKQDLAAFDPKQNDPKGTKQLEARLSGLDRQLAEVTKVRDSLLVDTQPKEVENGVEADADVIAAVDKADAEVDTTNEESKAASQASAKHVISLAMMHPGSFSDESLSRLADNARNSLSDSQRAYLRTVSASRLAENASKDGATVSKEIIKGDPAKQQLGIADYTSRMAMAISSGDTDKASTALHMLGKFAAGHAQKLALFKPLYEAAKKNGPTWVIPTKQGWEVASNQSLGNELRTKFGGLLIGAKSSKLLKGIELEVAALNAAQTQLQAAYNLKFDPTAALAPETKVDANPVPSVNSVDSKGAAEAASVDGVTSSPNQSTDVDSTVNPVVVSTVMPVPSLNQEIRLKDGSVVKVSPSGKEYFDGNGDLIDRNVVTEWRNVGDTQWNPPHWEGKWVPSKDGRTLTKVNNAAIQVTETSTQEAPVKSATTVGQVDAESIAAVVPTPVVAKPSVDTESTVDAAGNGEVESEGAGRLATLQEVINLAGEKFSTAYKKINLAAYNLKQKLGKDNKTQRPLIAVKAFLSNWPDEAGLAKFVGVTKLSETQLALLDHFKDLVSKEDGWLKTIEANLVEGKVTQGNARKRDMAAVRDAKDVASKRKAKELLDSRIASGYYTTISPEQMAEMRANDPIQYFIIKNEGKVDLEENIKTAIAVAAYTHIAENAKQPVTKDLEGVKAIFGLSEYDVIGDALVAAVTTLGDPSKVVMNSMGSRVAQALGLSATEEGTQDFLPVLESAFGAHVMKLLIDTGVMEQNVVEGSVITEGLAAYHRANEYKQTEDFVAPQQGNMNFVRMARTPDPKLYNGKLNVMAEVISENAKNTKGVLGKLFGVESQTVMPSWEPIPFTQKNTDNTNQGVPPDLAKIIAHENATPFKVNTQVWDLMQAMSKEEFLKMAGWIDTDPKTMHKNNILAANAKNDALTREYEVAFDYISQMEMGEQNGGSPLKLDQPIYLSHSVWKQQRVGIEGALNPQASKMHRWLLTRNAWSTEITVDAQGNSDLLDSFKLRVMEGLGVKTDKQANEKSLAGFDDLFNTKHSDPKVAKRALALQGAIDGINTGDFEAIIAGVAAGKEKMHSLDALRSMATYQLAQKEGKAYSFKVNMMGEVDGVTNGPMLSHLALGAKSPAGMMARLNKGGFFELDSGFTNYNVWRGGQSRQDLYEATIAAVIKRVTEQGNTANFEALQMITGQLHEEGTKILSAGRNIIKTPLTAMLFGSTVDGAIASMFRGFMEKTYEGFESIAEIKDATEQQTALKAYVANLNGLLDQAGAPKLPINESIAYFLEEEFTLAQEAALEAIFKDALGESVKETMQTEFADFLAVRDTINNTANATFGMYWAAYQGIRKDVIAELVKSGDIAANLKGKEYHDLTAKQEALIDQRVKALNPTVHTYMSKQSKGKNASNKYGLHISKSARTLSKEPSYRGSIHFGKAFESTGFMSIGTSAYQRILASPGVGMLPMMIHSLDSAISHMALMGRAVLNVHDAHGTGVSDFIETAKALNAATWKVLLGYSPATEMRDSFVNTLMGMESLLAEGNNDSVVKELQSYLEALAKKQAVWEDGKKIAPALNIVLVKVVQDMFKAAHTADMVKYETMSTLEYVDQYALEGGQFDVQDSDRDEASKLLEELGPEAVIPKSVWAAVDQINAAVLGKPESKAKNPSTNVWGTLGTPKIAVEPTLVNIFSKRNSVPAKALLATLETMIKKDNKEMASFYLALVSQLKDAVNPALMVHVVNANTATPEGVEPIFGAYGMFTNNPGNTAIYIPGAEFVNSGLNKQTLLHEIIHGTISQAIQNELDVANGVSGSISNPQATNLVANLKVILSQAQDYVKKNNITKFDAALVDLHELTAWGMTSTVFQTEVLSKISVPTSVGSVLINGMKAFIDAISSFFFTSKNIKPTTTNGMYALITNVAGLINQAGINKQASSPFTNLSLAMAPDFQDIQDLTTESLYNALDEGKVTPTFDTHLRGLLTSIVTKLHGPYGTFKSQIERNLVRTPKGLWDQAKRDGIVPFASASLAAGIQMNDQVAFVLEQVEVTVASALSDNKGEGHAISVEMDKLYREAQTKLTAADSPLSKELQDFLFKMDGGLGGKSDHLARFAALGLAHPEINAALQFNTSRVENKANPSFAGRLETLFKKILEWFNNKMVHTHAGQRADEKLTELVNQLVNIEAKRKAPMLEKSSTLAYVEGVLKDSTNKIKEKAEAAGRSDWVRNSKSNVIKAAGSVVSTLAGDRTEQVMEVIQQVRDKHFTDGQGLAMGLINEVRGSHDGNRMFHKLLREAKLREGQREDLIVHTGNVALESFANKGKDLSQEDKAALTAVILRTDLAALLGPFTMDQIQAMLNNPATRNRTIKNLEAQLAGMKDRGFYERQAKILGYKLATGNVKGKHLLMNATNIANLAGTRRKANVAEATAAMPIIDQLASLYALRYTNPKMVTAASKVMDAEAKRGGDSGVEMILRLHKSLQQQSREQLFNGSEALMMKGYTPEIYDPKKEVKVATEAEGKLLMEQGYSKGKKIVTYDPTDPSGKVERRIYTRDGGGLRPWLSGNMSYTSEASKGSRSRTNEVTDLADWKANLEELTYMHKAKQSQMATEFVYDPDFDPSMVDANYAAPTLNADGEVSDYRYLMREENKDILLNRDNRFDKVLGVFAGSIYDKTSTKEHNRKVVQALHDQYKADFGTKSVSYRKIGMDSTDPELRDIYRMLPEDTKQAIAEVWGTDKAGNSFMMVRSDLMDINFGYRKQSISDAFEKEKKNIVETFFVSVATSAMGGKAAYNLRRAEDVWQELVGEVKDILVVKNVSTLIGNIGSNVSLLYWQGVPFKDMVKYHRIALQGMTSYRADAAALIELETKLAAGVNASSNATMQREIARLKAAIETNPVKELIDAGLMPSIVEDVSPDNDLYSYKSRLTSYVDEKTSGLNKHVMGAARLGYMAKDTQVYKTLRHATQLSDFVARYSLYQHVISRKENPMSKADAVQLASDAFINYDIPSHRNLQYMNDMGFVMFTKYYLRIQKVIARLYADSPGRALAMLAFESYIANAPMLTDSGFFHKLGNNPFGLGALNYPGVLDELATIKAISYPFK